MRSSAASSREQLPVEPEAAPVGHFGLPTSSSIFGRVLVPHAPSRAAKRTVAGSAFGRIAASDERPHMNGQGPFARAIFNVVFGSSTFQTDSLERQKCADGSARVDLRESRSGMSV